MQHHRLWSTGLEGSLAGANVGSWWKTNWACIQFAAKKDDLILGSLKRDPRLWEGILHLCLALEHCAQSGCPQYQRDTEVLEWAWWWTTALVGGWSMGYVKRGCTSWAWSAWKKEGWREGALIAAWWECVRKAKQGFLQRCGIGIRNKLACGKFRASVRKNTSLWGRLDNGGGAQSGWGIYLIL